MGKKKQRIAELKGQLSEAMDRIEVQLQELGKASVRLEETEPLREFAEDLMDDFVPTSVAITHFARHGGKWRDAAETLAYEISGARLERGKK